MIVKVFWSEVRPVKCSGEISVPREIYKNGDKEIEKYCEDVIINDFQLIESYNVIIDEVVFDEVVITRIEKRIKI